MLYFAVTLGITPMGGGGNRERSLSRSKDTIMNYNLRFLPVAHYLNKHIQNQGNMCGLFTHFSWPSICFFHFLFKAFSQLFYAIMVSRNHHLSVQTHLGCLSIHSNKNESNPETNANLRLLRMQKCTFPLLRLPLHLLLLLKILSKPEYKSSQVQLAELPC